MNKSKKIRKPKRIFAHGAIKPILIDDAPRKGWNEWCIRFGATCDDEDYPVIFYGERQVRQLYLWLGAAIKYLDQKEGQK